MARLTRIGLLGFCVVVFNSCADAGRNPMAPSPSSVASALPALTLDWACGADREPSGATHGWSFEETPTSCPSAPVSAAVISAGLITTAPSNLRATVIDRTVQLNWDMPEAVTSFNLEAGSGPTLANLATFDTPTPALSLVVTNVPIGTYFVRVRGTGAGTHVYYADRSGTTADLDIDDRMGLAPKTSLCRPERPR